MLLVLSVEPSSIIMDSQFVYVWLLREVNVSVMLLESLYVGVKTQLLC